MFLCILCKSIYAQELVGTYHSNYYDQDYAVLVDCMESRYANKEINPKSGRDILLEVNSNDLGIRAFVKMSPSAAKGFANKLMHEWEKYIKSKDSNSDPQEGFGNGNVTLYFTKETKPNKFIFAKETGVDFTKQFKKENNKFILYYDGEDANNEGNTPLKLSSWNIYISDVSEIEQIGNLLNKAIEIQASSSRELKTDNLVLYSTYNLHNSNGKVSNNIIYQDAMISDSVRSIITYPQTCLDLDNDGIQFKLSLSSLSTSKDTVYSMRFEIARNKKTDIREHARLLVKLTDNEVLHFTATESKSSDEKTRIIYEKPGFWDFYTSINTGIPVSENISDIKVDFCVSPEYQVSKKALEQMLNGNATKIRIEGSLDNLDLEFHDNEFSNALKTLYPALVQEERKDADFSKGF